MIGVPFNLRRPAFVAFHQHSGSHSGQRGRSREKQWPAGNHVLRLANIGDNGLVGLSRTCTQAGQGQGSAHQLQELAPVAGIVPFRGVPRKLLLQKPRKLFALGKLFKTAPVVTTMAAQQSQLERTVPGLHP